MKEFELLRHIYGANPVLPARITIRPGDDMGAVDPGAIGQLTSEMERQILVTVDQLIDGVHFDFKSTPLEKIARKAITRNLSDVAAMAARPLGAVAAACFPLDFPHENAQALADAMRSIALDFDCPLFGGDVSSADAPLSITVTVLARPDGVIPVLRSGASIGDVVFVTGALGGSLENVNGHLHHLEFEPRIALARLLAANPQTRPTAMLDISDGLGRDLGHICRASNVSALIDCSLLPISDAAKQAAAHDGKPPWRHAIADGEDYELCFTISADRAANLPKEAVGIPLSRIGVIDTASAWPAKPFVRLRTPEGLELDADNLGWEHGK
jgi:thiamine-monophosphate kinase